MFLFRRRGSERGPRQAAAVFSEVSISAADMNEVFVDGRKTLLLRQSAAVPEARPWSLMELVGTSSARWGPFFMGVGWRVGFCILRL